MVDNSQCKIDAGDKKYTILILDTGDGRAQLNQLALQAVAHEANIVIESKIVTTEQFHENDELLKGFHIVEPENSLSLDQFDTVGCLLASSKSSAWGYSNKKSSKSSKKRNSQSIFPDAITYGPQLNKKKGKSKRW